MKKLFLVPLICCSQFTQPITLKNAIGYTALAGGTGSLIYTSYKKSTIDRKITTIRTQLRNTQLSPADRAKLVKELHELIDLSSRYNKMAFASAAACGIGYRHDAGRSCWKSG